MLALEDHEMSRTTREQRRRRDEASARTARRRVAAIVSAYRECEAGTVMTDRVSEDRRADALRALAADELARLAEHGHADAMADAAARVGLTLSDLEVWAGTPSAHRRRAAMVELRDAEAARLAVAKRLVSDARDVARLERVTVETSARIDRVAMVTDAAVSTYRETTAERAERIRREGRATAPRPPADPWTILAEQLSALTFAETADA